jgi:uncharacterized protein involved in exopolysaccharide biosynthesis
VGAMGLAATQVLPKKYTSTTIILVEPPAVAEEAKNPSGLASLVNAELS